MFQILLVTALCLDAFTASLACGVSRTRMPPLTILVISLLCTLALAASTGLGSAAKNIIPASVSGVIAFVILLLIGLVKCFEYFIKRLISRRNNKGQIKMKLFDLNFVLTVYADTAKADIDQSKTLSVMEAVYLSAALSFDGFAAGFGWGFTSVKYVELILLSLLSNVLAVMMGYFLGKLLTKIIKFDFSWVGGVILVVLAFLKLTY